MQVVQGVAVLQGVCRLAPGCKSGSCNLHVASPSLDPGCGEEEPSERIQMMVEMSKMIKNTLLIYLVN